MNEFCLHDHKHNLKYNLAHEFFWGFGVAFHTVYAISPLFLRELGAPESIVVSTAGFFAILIALPTLFIAVFGRNIQNIKGAVLKVHLLIIYCKIGCHKNGRLINILGTKNDLLGQLPKVAQTHSHNLLCKCATASIGHYKMQMAILKRVNVICSTSS